MAKFFLVRHGQTEWNEGSRYQGHSNVLLSSFGRKQAEGLRRRLSGESIDIIYSSDLSRARDTAQVIASDCKAEVIACEELRELDFGELEGMPVAEVNRRYPQISQAWTTHPLGGQEDVSQVLRIRLSIAVVGPGSWGLCSQYSYARACAHSDHSPDGGCRRGPMGRHGSQGRWH